MLNTMPSTATRPYRRGRCGQYHPTDTFVVGRTEGAAEEPDRGQQAQPGERARQATDVESRTEVRKRR